METLEHPLEEGLSSVSLPLGEMLSLVKSECEETPVSWQALATRLRAPTDAERMGPFFGALALLRTMGAIQVSGDSYSVRPLGRLLCF